VSEPPRATSVVAAFDVDGTLTTRDCLTPFLVQTAGVRLVPALARHPATVVGALARRDRDHLKEVVCRTLRGLDADALAEVGERYAGRIAERWLRDDVVARLDRHRALGHVTVLASASLEPYLIPLARRLSVDGVICTRLERGSDGRLTGRLEGANCRGAEKARRLDEWLRERGLESATLWAYGDSAGDAELLARADHPVWVGDTRLAPNPV